MRTSTNILALLGATCSTQAFFTELFTSSSQEVAVVSDEVEDTEILDSDSDSDSDHDSDSDDDDYEPEMNYYALDSKIYSAPFSYFDFVKGTYTGMNQA
jgi:hypothetical protein